MPVNRIFLDSIPCVIDDSRLRSLTTILGYRLENIAIGIELCLLNDGSSWILRKRLVPRVFVTSAFRVDFWLNWNPFRWYHIVWVRNHVCPSVCGLLDCWWMKLRVLPHVLDARSSMDLLCLAVCFWIRGLGFSENVWLSVWVCSLRYSIGKTVLPDKIKLSAISENVNY